MAIRVFIDSASCWSGALEDDLESELRLPGVAHARRLAEVAGSLVRLDRGLRRVENHRRQAHVRVERLRQEVRVVEEVEDLEPRLDLHLGAGADRLVERHVGLAEAGAAALTALFVANRAELEAGEREGGRIQDLLWVGGVLRAAVTVDRHVRPLVVGIAGARGAAEEARA